MAEFLSSYGLWILLGGIFVAMHAFGMGCCGGHGGHQQGPRRTEEPEGEAKSSPASTPGKAGATSKGTAGSCH